MDVIYWQCKINFPACISNDESMQFTFTGSIYAIHLSGGCMSIDMEGKVAHLSGDWTVTSLTKWKIELLADVLQQIEDGHGWKLLVDCGDMTATDRAGLELLHVWLQCARFRGFEPELINLPADLTTPLKSLTAQSGSSVSNPNCMEHKSVPLHQPQRSIHHENRRNQNHRQAV